jgi:hypothetical protein
LISTDPSPTRRKDRSALTRRAEAHIVRICAIDATLDRRQQIAVPHLEPPLAVRRYSLDSARWILGDSLGDPTADETWMVPKGRPNEVIRTEVLDLFQNDERAVDP